MIQELYSQIDGYRSENPVDITSTHINRRSYACVAESCLAEYNRINDLNSITVDSVDSSLHSFSRVVCSMAVIRAEGNIGGFGCYDSRLFASDSQFRALFERLMTDACNSLPAYRGKDVLNFSVKELMLSYRLVKDITEPDLLATWAKKLSEITTEPDCYSNAQKNHKPQCLHNGGEQLRTECGHLRFDCFY